MAKPDCDDGWYKKSIELEAALDFADFTKIARTILRYGFCQIFGQGRRPRYMKILCPEIALRIGKHQQHVYRALDELVKSGVLFPVAGKPGMYRFVKDYEKWTFIARCKSTFVATSMPRLSEEEVRDCVASVAYSKSFDLETNTDESFTNFGEVENIKKLRAFTNIGEDSSPRLVKDVGHTCLCDIEDDNIATHLRVATCDEASELRRTRPELIEMDCIEIESKKKKTTSSSDLVRAQPQTAEELIDSLSAFTDDPKQIALITRKIPLWIAQFERKLPQYSGGFAEWVWDALNIACGKDDIVTYASKVIVGFMEAGGREGIELPGPASRRNQAKPTPTPNLPLEGETKAKIASINSEQARLDSLKAAWDALDARARQAIEAEFDRDNPRPSDQLPKFWSTIRLRGCQELMDRTRPQQREAQ